MPPDGGIIRLENVQMKPLFPKSKLNAKLSIRVLGRTVRSNSLPCGHTDLHRRHPGVKEDFVKGVLIIEVFSTSFRPEMVENEASKDVEGLLRVSETAGVVREKSGGGHLRLPRRLRLEARKARWARGCGRFSIRPKCARRLSRLFEPWYNREGNAAGSLRRPSYTPCIEGGDP